ncbi:MAG: arsenic transporter [Chitinivibrionia bacterium]|nr:arsenic transporter [Chitinivibrionia bacterium]
MSPIGPIIFVVTYILICFRRLTWLQFDRPAVALFGAVACVVFGALTHEEAMSAVDGSTILLLFGVMGMGAFLAVDGLFQDFEASLVAFTRTPARLMACIVWTAGIMSAFITNDAVCVLGAPVVVEIIRRQQLPPLPFLLALATAANTGSVMTLVGNPQNMLCAMLGDLSYREHLMLMLPVGIFGLIVNHVLLYVSFRRELRGRVLAETQSRSTRNPRTIATLGIIAATAVVYALGANLPWTATSGFVLLMLVHRRNTRELWGRIDWSLLLFFMGLFVVVEALMKSGIPELVFVRLPLAAAADGFGGWFRLSGIFLIGSNIVSNVPFILVVKDQMATLPDARLGWEMLAMASTFAGNLTILGSVANIIVAENARDIGGIGFMQYVRIGLPLALISTLAGTIWLVLTAAG